LNFLGEIWINDGDICLFGVIAVLYSFVGYISVQSWSWGGDLLCLLFSLSTCCALIQSWGPWMLGHICRYGGAGRSWTMQIGCRHQTVLWCWVCHNHLTVTRHFLELRWLLQKTLLTGGLLTRTSVGHSLVLCSVMTSGWLINLSLLQSRSDSTRGILYVAVNSVICLGRFNLLLWDNRAAFLTRCGWMRSLGRQACAHGHWCWVWGANNADEVWASARSRLSILS
jgi:hypothetical protein